MIYSSDVSLRRSVGVSKEIPFCQIVLILYSLGIRVNTMSNLRGFYRIHDHGFDSEKHDHLESRPSVVILSRMEELYAI